MGFLIAGLAFGSFICLATSFGCWIAWMMEEPTVKPLRDVVLMGMLGVVFFAWLLSLSGRVS